MKENQRNGISLLGADSQQDKGNHSCQVPHRNTMEASSESGGRSRGHSELQREGTAHKGTAPVSTAARGIRGSGPGIEQCSSREIFKNGINHLYFKENCTF